MAKRASSRQLILLCALSASLPASAQQLDSPFLQTCEQAGERLWGHSLCAPIVAVNPETGEYRTSRPAPDESLPAMRANTAFSWGEEPWIMVLEPLPSDPAERASLLFHEAWHVHQDALGFPSNNIIAKHLDEPVSRYLLRLEWAALQMALAAKGLRQRKHIEQALAFRKRRLEETPHAADAERQQMQHEGIAAYTGVALSGDPLRLALAALRSGAQRPSLGRSFAYVSGPAWGLLLDRYRPSWRAVAGEANLPDLMPFRAAAVGDADAYGGAAILSDEMLAAADRERRIATAVKATSEERGLRLPLTQMNMDFDPNLVSSAPDGSTIYHCITLGDQWGRVKVDSIGIRILPNFTAAFAPWPLPEGALDLAQGWRIEKQPGGGAALVKQD